MGLEAAKSIAGQTLVTMTTRPAERATQAVDYGRRGAGYVFGAFQPHTGAVLTGTAQRRTTATVVVFLEQVETWIDSSVERAYAVLDNLSAHRATDVLLFALAHPRWEFVFQPTYAASLTLIEPWWKILRSLALKCKRFETWEQIEDAVRAASASWNSHRHPFVWGRRHRHQPRRSPGVARVLRVP
jgi:hypothetical protein